MESASESFVCATNYGASTVITELPKFSPAAEAILVGAKEEAKRRNRTFVGTEHFLLSLLLKSDSNPSRIFHYIDGIVQKSNQSWKHQLLNMLDGPICGFVGKPASNNTDDVPFSPAMLEVFSIVNQICHGPVSDGSTIIYDGLVASEFLVAAIMLHGVNMASEMLARISKGKINSWTILDAINVDPNTVHVNRSSVMKASSFTKGDMPFIQQHSAPFISGETTIPTLSQLPESPSEDSNWLIPGRLVIGAKPDEHQAQLLVNVGVTTFVSLIGEHTFSEFQRGSRRIQYPQAIARGTFIHFPIQDFEVPALDQLEALVIELKQRIVQGECIFVHCRGGHGRTGTVVIPLISSLFDVDNTIASEYVNLCTSTTRPSDRVYASHGWAMEMPETEEQREATLSINDVVRFKTRRKR